MATHSSVLAWRLPGTGEPGGLPSMGSHRVRHDWSNLAVVTIYWLLGLSGHSYSYRVLHRKGNGTPLQYSCLENPMDGGAWCAADHGSHGESDKTERLHFQFSLSCIGEGNGNRLQCSCLENPRDRGAWWAAIYGVTQSWTRLKWLSSSSTDHYGTY